MSGSAAANNKKSVCGVARVVLFLFFVFAGEDLCVWLLLLVVVALHAVVLDD